MQNNQTALNEETITKEIRQLVEHDDNVDNLPESIKTTLRKAIATGIDDICLKIKDVLHDILGKQLYASLKENIYKHIHPTNWEQIEKETTTPISKRIEKKKEKIYCFQHIQQTNKKPN
ncbi:MAG: hypothetical protein HWD59_10840 [Coxiellaceae bacterium]|nr:MAG: hypothetical protein HWD59_10840 [Coxiellaceae bacterium]